MTEIANPRLQRALGQLMGRRTVVTLADLSLPDAPLVYVNQAFEEMTGYAAQEALGRNCRFLQGPDTDPAAATRIRKAVTNGTEGAYCLLNYRRDGTPFHNLLMLAPLPTNLVGGTYMLGCQYRLHPGTLGVDVAAQVDRVQGVVGELSERIKLPAPIWSSMQARSDAIRLLVDAYLLMQAPDR